MTLDDNIKHSEASLLMQAALHNSPLGQSLNDFYLMSGSSESRTTDPPFGRAYRRRQLKAERKAERQRRTQGRRSNKRR